MLDTFTKDDAIMDNSLFAVADRLEYFVLFVVLLLLIVGCVFVSSGTASGSSFTSHPIATIQTRFKSGYKNDTNKVKQFTYNVSGAKQVTSTGENTLKSIGS